jgi:hypothetical protein
MSLTTTSLLAASLNGKLQLEALTPVESNLFWVLVLPSILSEAHKSPILFPGSVDLYLACMRMFWGKNGGKELFEL